MPVAMTPRVLVFDIETSTILAHVWQLYDQNISLEGIETEWSILCYAAKFLGEKKIYFDSTGGRGKSRVRDDKKLMKGLFDLLDEADIVVGQNCKKFDIKKVNARLIEHGFGPPSPFKVVDTTLEARKYFGFTSKKLEWMSKHLTDCPKDSHKAFPGLSLWKECLADNPKAWAEMRKYNIRDVEATEKVYMRLRPWMASHPNVGAFLEDKDLRCPKCGSKDLQSRGYAFNQQGKYPRFQCNECGGWARGKATAMAPVVRKNLLVGVG